MPTIVPDFNDLNLQYGTQLLTLGGGPNNMPITTFYVEDWSAETQTNIVNVPNQVGKIRGRVIIDQDKGGTATLQLENTSSVPRIGATGSMPAGFVASGSAASIMISSVGTPRNVNDYAKANISWLLANP